MTSPTLITAPLPTDQYWAAVETDRLADTIRAKAEEFRHRLESEGRIALQRRAERMYYGQDGEGGWANSVAVTYGGEDGELTMLRVNHYRSIVQGLLATAAKSRPAFEAMSINSDAQSLQQAALVNGVLDDYYREHGLETIHLETDRAAVVLGEGYTALRWSPWRGQIATWKDRPALDEQGQPKMQPGQPVPVTEPHPETGEPMPVLDASGEPVTEQGEPVPVTERVPMREGDVEAHSFAPIEIVRDLDATTERNMRWALVPYRENVWELAARYPTKRAELVAMRGNADLWPRSAWDAQSWQRTDPNSDSVTAWYLYHEATDAMPEGRQSIVVGDVVLVDGPMQLPEVPVYACMPEREMATASGYSPQFDLLALQEVLDSIITIMVSSHDALALQNVLTPDGSDVTPEIIGRGLRLLKWKPSADIQGGGKPEALQLLALSKDSYELADLMKVTMEVLSGINSVVRGDPMPQLKSGAALALVQSLAVAFNSQLQRAIALHHERVATGLVRMLQAFAHTKRIASVVGRTRKTQLKEWNSEALQGIQRVSIQIGNPLADTLAGRVAMADAFLEKGVLTSAAEYEEVYQTGRLQPQFESDDAALMNVRQENEALAEGQPVVMLLTDDHAMHIREHRAVVDNQSIRAKSPDVVRAALAHIDEHMNAWLTMPPPLALLTKQSVMPPVMAPPPGPPGAGPDGPPGPPSGPSGGPPSADADRAKPLGQPGNRDMPLMPTNPLTNERAPA